MVLLSFLSLHLQFSLDCISRKILQGNMPRKEFLKVGIFPKGDLIPPKIP